MEVPNIVNREFRDCAEKFLQYLENMSYQTDTLDNYRRILVRIDHFMTVRNIVNYTVDTGQAFCEEQVSLQTASRKSSNAIRTAVMRFNDFLLGKPYVMQHSSHCEPALSGEFDQCLSAYLLHCRQSGNKETTIRRKRGFLVPFLHQCQKFGFEEIRSVNASIIVRVCMLVENKEAFAVIRDFLRFLCAEGIVPRDMSVIVPRYKRAFKIPSTYSNEEILRMEQMIDRTSPTGIRDYAMILLVTRLGMRSGDIAELELQSIDYNSEKIHFVQQKTGTEMYLPLLPEIKEAICGYIHEVRPVCSSPKLFLRISAPYAPITTSVIRFAVNRYLRMAGIDTSGKHHGPHAFRASLASSMVNENVPYEAIRGILGHKDPDAVKHYAKLDIEQLRKCAIPVPPPTGAFQTFLEGGLNK